MQQEQRYTVILKGRAAFLAAMQSPWPYELSPVTRVNILQDSGRK